MTPGTLDLRVQRWTPFTYAIAFPFDFTGATMAMHVRSYRDAPGSPLINLQNATAPAQGLSVSVATVGGVTTSTVQIRIDETTIEALLPFPASGVRAGEDVPLVWDIHITGGGFAKSRWIEGAFIIKSGATQNG